MILIKQLALCLALVALFSLTASAAGVEIRAMFNLAEQAYWGSSLLPPGDYSVTLAGLNSGTKVFYVRGEGVTATLLAAAVTEDVSTGSFLTVDNFDGTHVIRELNARFIGKTFRFPASKAVRNLTLRGSAAQPVTIPISLGSGL